MNSAHAAKAVFSHRHNADHTIDSICHKCFRTVATDTAEAALWEQEQMHECSPAQEAFSEKNTVSCVVRVTSV